MSLIRNTTWSALSAVLLSGGRFLLSMLLARKLGVEDFGRFAFIQWLMDMAIMFCAFGLPGAANRFFAELNGQPGRQKAFEKWFFLRGSRLLIFVAIGFPLATFVFGYGLPASGLLTLAGWAAATLMLALLTARAQGLMRFKRLAVSNVVYITVALVGCMSLPEQGNDLIHIILIIMVATVLGAAVLWSPLPSAGANSGIDLPEDVRDSIKKFGLNIWITGLVSALVWSRGEMVFVQSMLGVNDVAMYAVALTLVGLATQGLMLLTGALGPHLTQMWGDGKLREAHALCRFLTNILTLSAAILSAFLILFGTELILFAYGSKFQDADRILPILGLGTFGLASAAANQLLQIKTDGRFGRNSNLLGAASLFGLALPLILLCGTEGAAASRVFVQLAIGLAALYLVSRLISSEAVNWMVQGKAFVLVCLLMVFQAFGPFSLHIRAFQFLIVSLLAMVWLTEQQDRLKMGSVVRSFLSRGRH